MKEEFKKDILEKIWIIKQASEELLETLEKNGESVLSFETLFNLKSEANYTKVKFSKIADNFEKESLDIFKLKS